MENRKQSQNDEYMATSGNYGISWRLWTTLHSSVSHPLIERYDTAEGFNGSMNDEREKILLSGARYSMQETRRDKSRGSDKEVDGEREKGKRRRRKKRVVQSSWKKHDRLRWRREMHPAASSGTIFCWTQVPASNAPESVAVPTSGEIMYGSSALAAISYTHINFQMF